MKTDKKIDMKLNANEALVTDSDESEDDDEVCMFTDEDGRIL